MEIVIADGRPETRSALQLLLAEEPDMRVVAEAHDADSLLAAVRVHLPDVVLADWELPDARPVDDRDGSLPVEVSHASPRTRFIALSVRVEAHRLALAAGADAFVSKCESPKRLIGALRSTNGKD
ncbi:MAG: response regulator transcription factor [Coriobacteriia bacterium]|nr:response regulator transcription factor [Coriobacteriia bacterium]